WMRRTVLVPFYLSSPRPTPRPPPFPYTTLFRSRKRLLEREQPDPELLGELTRLLLAEILDDRPQVRLGPRLGHAGPRRTCGRSRSEEHTSELQSRSELVCRLLLEKKKKNDTLTY